MRVHPSSSEKGRRARRRLKLSTSRRGNFRYLHLDTDWRGSLGTDLGRFRQNIFTHQRPQRGERLVDQEDATPLSMFAVISAPLANLPRSGVADCHIEDLSVGTSAARRLLSSAFRACSASAKHSNGAPLRPVEAAIPAMKPAFFAIGALVRTNQRRLRLGCGFRLPFDARRRSTGASGTPRLVLPHSTITPLRNTRSPIRAWLPRSHGRRTWRTSLRTPFSTIQTTETRPAPPSPVRSRQ